MVRLVALVILAIYCLPSWACELSIAIRTFPPFAMQNEQQQWQGTDVDIFNALFKPLNCQLKFHQTSFSHGLLLTMSGEISAMAQLSITSERSEKLYFIGPIRHEELVLITTQEVKETISSYADIMRLPYFFAKRKGTYVGAEFEKWYQGNRIFRSKFVEVDNTVPRVELIHAKRVVGFFEEKAFNDYGIKYLPSYQKMKQHPLHINNGEVYIGLSKMQFSAEKFELLQARWQQIKSKFR